MTKIIIFAITALMGLAAQAQEKFTETRTVQNFTGIEVSRGIEVIYTQGNETTVTAEADSKVNLSYITAQSNGKTLKITLQEPEGHKMKSPMFMTVYVTSPMLKNIKASAGASVKTPDNITAEALTIDLSSGGTFCGKLVAKNFSLTARSGAGFRGVVNTETLRADLRGGASVKFSGSARNTIINSDSGATCMAGSFLTDKASINAQGTSSVLVRVKDRIKAKSDNAATITYYGHPLLVLDEGSYAVKKTEDKL